MSTRYPSEELPAEGPVSRSNLLQALRGGSIWGLIWFHPLRCPPASESIRQTCKFVSVFIMNSVSVWLLITKIFFPYLFIHRLWWSMCFQWRTSCLKRFPKWFAPSRWRKPRLFTSLRAICTSETQSIQILTLCMWSFIPALPSRNTRYAFAFPRYDSNHFYSFFNYYFYL